MNQQRIHAALSRIEAAADRIATGSRGSRRGSPRGVVDPGLARRHMKLREEAGAALAELDQLILELSA